jgi:isocitrate lyase
LEVVEFMADATDIPILLDADTGYGNFNNARRLVRKLEDRGVAGKKPDVALSYSVICFSVSGIAARLP